jgi:hypothetical protein
MEPAARRGAHPQEEFILCTCRTCKGKAEARRRFQRRTVAAHLAKVQDPAAETRLFLLLFSKSFSERCTGQSSGAR